MKPLVHIAGFIPAAGETIGELAARSTPPLPLISTQVPGGTEISLDPARVESGRSGYVGPVFGVGTIFLTSIAASNMSFSDRPVGSKPSRR